MEKINLSVSEHLDVPLYVWIGDKKEPFTAGTRYLDLALKYQSEYENQIVLTLVNGKLQELNKYVAPESSVQFVTTADKPGMQSYQRSVILLLIKSIHDVAGHDQVEKVTVEFAVSRGLFIHCQGDFKIDQAFLDKVEERMRYLVEEDLAINKRSVHTDNAVEMFHKHGMYDKEKLFNYRRVSKVNIYSINEFEDYYYGYMCPSTGYLKYFKLYLFGDGFVLQMPTQYDPKVVPPFAPQQKLFRVLSESGRLGEQLRVPDVGSLNDAITKGRINELILVQEAVQEKKLAEIANLFQQQPDRKIIMIAGPSSSGKTTFSHRLSIQLIAHGLRPHPIAIDDYFIDREKSPKDEHGNYDYESLECIDINQFSADMRDLLAGKTVEMPSYNFKTGRREYKGNTLTLGPEDILVIEGIHGLNNRLTAMLPGECKFKIYISALTQLNIDEHNYIPTTDGRLLRRIVRDARTRGATAQDTIRMWMSVRRGEERNIFPFQEEADVMFNSALIYELSVLKQYVEPLLFSVPKSSAEYLEAKRMLKFLDYFLGVSSENVPANSILREFIGGSCFKV